MSDSKNTLIVDVKDFNELIGVIAVMNKQHEDNYTAFMSEIKKLNAEHEKRYNEFYRISMQVFKELKRSVSDHEVRIEKLEKKMERLEKLINGG